MYDLVVIGAGPGGYVAAIHAARAGLRCALVEKGEVGGTCLNRGCIPTKTLLHTANLYRELAVAADLGIQVDGLRTDWPALYTHKEDIVQKLREGILFLLKANGVELVQGTAFVPKAGSVEVDGQTLQTKNILVATGSAPAIPPVPGFGLPGVLTSDGLLEAPPPEGPLVIIGAGVIGCEFASIFSALGRPVTLLEAEDRILPALDREISQSLAMLLKKRGVQVVAGAAVQRVEKGPEGLACHYVQKDAPHIAKAAGILVATGRRPVYEGLFPKGLVAGGRGIRVDESFATSAPGIWAIGDVVEGSAQLAHAASAEAEAVIAHMQGLRPEMNLELVPACVYTSPEIACVGITADQARERNIPVKTGKFATAGLGKSLIEGAGRGFIKLVSHSETGILLGAQLMCPRATDLVSECTTAIANGLTAAQFASVIRPHPTFTEGVSEAAEDLFGRAVHIAPKRRPE